MGSTGGIEANAGEIVINWDISSQNDQHEET